MANLDFNGLLNNVRTLVSSSTTWQAITGTANAAEAADFVYKGGYYEETIDPPICIINVNPWNGIWTGGRIAVSGASVSLWFDIPIPAGSRGTFEDEYSYCMTQVSGLLADFSNGIQGGGQLMATGIGMEAQPGRIDEDDNNGRCDWRFVLSLLVEMK